MSKSAIVFGIVASLFVLGCGGGTNGTSIDSTVNSPIEVSGILTDESLQPIRDAEIIAVDDIGDRSATDVDGGYNLSVRRGVGEIVFQVNINAQSYDVLTALDLPGKKFSVDLVYSHQKNEVTGIIR